MLCSRHPTLVARLLHIISSSRILNLSHFSPLVIHRSPTPIEDYTPLWAVDLKEVRIDFYPSL